MKADTLAELGFRDRLKDGSLGPAMVMIPGGSFTMGTQPGKAADPSQEVCLAPFALGRYAVSFSEYDAFAEATGYKKPDDAGWGRGTRPVINVSWHDAQAYVAWLSEQTGQRYRLPSEAEWEYACRAGTATHFYWGDNISPQLANYDSRFFYQGEAEERFRRKTLPVDAFAPNAFGLWQMHGNVWEWCEDAWHEPHPVASPDGNGWSAPRVLRGGSWRDDAQTMRSAYRAWNFPHAWADFGGFRLARTL